MICIIDCRLGNLRNVQKAFEKIGVKAAISSIASDIQKAQALVLPGVGAFGDAMDTLQELGLITVIRTEVLEKKKPILGICLGMQLLGVESYEKGHHQGLGILPMSIQKLEPQNPECRVPHVGWNAITVKNNASLFTGLPEKPDFYFVHSFHAVCEDQTFVAATCTHGQEFVAAVEKANIFATQFHPEKSQAYGLHVLSNFVRCALGEKVSC